MEVWKILSTFIYNVTEAAKTKKNSISLAQF